MFEKYFGKSSGKGKTDYQKDLEEGTKGENKKESALSYYSGPLFFAGLSTLNATLSVLSALTLKYPDNIFVSTIGALGAIVPGAYGVMLYRDFRKWRKEKNAQYNMHD